MADNLHPLPSLPLPPTPLPHLALQQSWPLTSLLGLPRRSPPRCCPCQIRLGDDLAVEEIYKGVDTDQPLTPDHKDDQGNTILIMAARWGHVRVRAYGLL